MFNLAYHLNLSRFERFCKNDTIVIFVSELYTRSFRLLEAPSLNLEHGCKIGIDFPLLFECCDLTINPMMIKPLLSCEEMSNELVMPI